MKAVTILLLLAVTFLCGCASTIADRKKERLTAYSQLPPETQTLVDTGQVKVGMPKDAVYIAWGKPNQTLLNETDRGRTETWLYYGSTLRPYHYWNYSFSGWDPFYRDTFLWSPLPHLETDFYPEYYLSGEVTFQNDMVANWRNLSRPPY